VGAAWMMTTLTSSQSMVALVQASITLPIYFLGGIQLLSLGVIGEYLGKLYIEAKRRPRYFIERIVEGSPDRIEPLRPSETVFSAGS
jgi:hypothetical protein